MLTIVINISVCEW